MTYSLPLPAELVALPAELLAELLAATPGDSIALVCATLGLDLAVPEHRAAVERALLVTVPLIPAGPGGVRSDLTPESPAPAGPHTEQGSGVGDPHSPGEPVDLLDALAAFRGRPDPFLAGTFAMYSALDGSVVVVTDIPGRGVEQRAIPAKAIRVAVQAMSGKGVLGKVFGRG